MQIQQSRDKLHINIVVLLFMIALILKYQDENGGSVGWSEVISAIALMVSVVSAGIMFSHYMSSEENLEQSRQSLELAREQWAKVNEKIAMLTDAESVFQVVPTWYSSRMLNDHWYYVIHTVDGSSIGFSNIISVSSDGKWMDISLLHEKDISWHGYAASLKDSGLLILAVAEDRRNMSVQIDKIVAAHDLVTS